jgi:hypothetical protein
VGRCGVCAAPQRGHPVKPVLLSGSGKRRLQQCRPDNAKVMPRTSLHNSAAHFKFCSTEYTALSCTMPVHVCTAFPTHCCRLSLASTADRRQGASATRVPGQQARRRITTRAWAPPRPLSSAPPAPP